jgi:hypothetical protein
MDIYESLLSAKSGIVVVALFVNVLTSIFKSFVPAAIEKKYDTYLKGAYRLAVLGISTATVYCMNSFYGFGYNALDGLAVAITSYGIYEIGYKQIQQKIKDIVLRKKK